MMRRRFANLLRSVGTIGKLTIKSSGPDPEITWETLYECKAEVQVLRGSERFEADAARAVATHRIFFPPHDLQGRPMTLDETMEFVEAVPFDYKTQKNLPRYRFKLVDPLGGHHFEVEAERVSPGG